MAYGLILAHQPLFFFFDEAFSFSDEATLFWLLVFARNCNFGGLVSLNGRLDLYVSSWDSLYYKKIIIIQNSFDNKLLLLEIVKDCFDSMDEIDCY